MAVVLVMVPPAGGALEVKLSTVPARPSALERTKIVLRTYVPLLREDGSCCRLQPGGPRSYPFRVEAVSPTGKTSRIRMRWAKPNLWSGVRRFPIPGSWTVRVVNYGPSYAHAPGARPRIRVKVGAAIPTPSPRDFGPLGGPRCEPPSPADRSPRPFRDIFGTAIGDEQLWALPFLPAGATWGQTDSAVFEGLIGKEVKIVFGMTMFHAPFQAIGPGGEVVAPVWGPRFHSSSNWIRQPGSEWGAGFVFPKTGCWRIRVGARGDLWMLIRS